jgi:zinc transporter 1/2/3
MTILKNFGTGVILSTALVHLSTHATLMFESDCLGPLDYEATTAAITLAGIMLSFLPDYIGTRLVLRRARHSHATSLPSHHDEPHADTKNNTHSSSISAAAYQSTRLVESSPALAKMKVTIMEAGIIFHSILIGLTLMVAGDSFFKILAVVILFHQSFEGLTLGSRIADLQETHMMTKLLMAGAFALVTPIGMAIGIGVLNQFNGNDPATIVAIGTLDALSAGILLWVGLVEMLAHDWMQGELATAPMAQVVPAGVSLVLGLVLMSLLGKWA